MDAPGAEIPIRTIRHISTHPNLGGTPLVVSLGCEKLQPERLLPGKPFAKLPVLESDPYLVRMQDEHGFGEVVSAIMRAAEKRLEQLNRRQRTAGARIRTGGRLAVRRQRRLFGRDL
jgi:galactarate dehydratase